MPLNDRARASLARSAGQGELPPPPSLHQQWLPTYSAPKGLVTYIGEVRGEDKEVEEDDYIM